MSENAPPPIEGFSDTERLFEHIVSDSTMPPELRALCDQVEAIQFSSSTEASLQEMIAALTAHLDVTSIHYPTIRRKISHLQLLLAMHNPSPLPEGDYEAS